MCIIEKAIKQCKTETQGRSSLSNFLFEFELAVELQQDFQPYFFQLGVETSTRLLSIILYVGNMRPFILNRETCLVSCLILASGIYPCQ